MTPRMALATWLNDVLYAIVTVQTPPRGVREPHGTDFHAPQVRPNDLQWRLVSLEEGDFACAVA